MGNGCLSSCNDSSLHNLKLETYNTAAIQPVFKSVVQLISITINGNH